MQRDASPPRGGPRARFAGLRAALENLFMVVVVGDMIGLPVLPPYYSLRLLPFVTPEITTWKRRVLREREFTDEHELHLHGV